MRRLPVYFLIDISESMIGEPIQQVEEGVATIIKALKTDPYAIETVWISIIVFAGLPRTIIPLQEVITFYPPKIPIGGGTSLSKGLGHLMYELKNNIVKTTYDQKGDWKPIVFLFTDGVPTDDTKQAIMEWKQNWQRSANMIAVSFGSETDMNVLSELTENILLFKNTDASSYKQFFKWVTDSIKTSSVSVEKNASGFELASLDGDIISKIDLTKKTYNEPFADKNFVVLSGMCQNTKRPYLIKYRRSVSKSEIPHLNLQTLCYRLVGAFQVDNSYFELSDKSSGFLKVNTDELLGFPTCPCCGNQIGLALCTCGKIHCIANEEVSTCPWCGTENTYEKGGGGFDLTRTKG